MASKEVTQAFAEVLHDLVRRSNIAAESAKDEAHAAVDAFLGTGAEAPKADK